MSGKLDANPFLQGIIVQSMRRLNKAERGRSSFGPKPKCSETEDRLVSNAAFTFALAGGNRELAIQLGQNLKAPQLRNDCLHEMGLPNPMLALTKANASQLEKNCELVDLAFPRGPSQSPKRMVVAIDHTYLQRALCQVKFGDHPGVVGGCWRPSTEDDDDRSFMKFSQLPEGALQTQRAPLMLEVLCWDPTCVPRKSLSLASMPMSLKPATDKEGTSRNHGKWVSRIMLAKLSVIS